jgi:hypothetical protein
MNALTDLLFQTETRTFVRPCQMLGFALHSEKPNSTPIAQNMEPLPSITEETALPAYFKTGFLLLGV